MIKVDLNQNRTSRKSTKLISTSKTKFILYTSFFLALTTFISLSALAYLKDDTSPKEQLLDVAGAGISRTIDFTNPKKDEKRYQSTLVMGIDTRGVKFDGEKYVPEKPDGTRKIDVIMQILYDRKTGKLTFISIPRDTSLVVTEECMHQEKEDQKYINRIYDMAEKNNCPESGAQMMKKYVSYITGYEIDNYAIITLENFIEIINIVGEEQNGQKGIWVDVPRNISDYCPNEYNGYDYVHYSQGRQFLTSKSALCYIRVRQTSNDFDRNRRQQELIDEIFRLTVKDDKLTNPLEIYKIYNNFKSDMQMSKIDLQTITMGLELLSGADLENIQKIVLDDQFGGQNAYLTKPLYSPPGTHTREGGFYLIPTLWDQSCCIDDEWKMVRKYLHELVEDPLARPKQASIYAYVHRYTASKAVFSNKDFNNSLKDLESDGIYIKKSQFALPIISTGSDIQIFDFSNGSKAEIAKEIAQKTNGTLYDASKAPFTRFNNEEIVIVVRVP